MFKRCNMKMQGLAEMKRELKKKSCYPKKNRLQRTSSQKQLQYSILVMK